MIFKLDEKYPDNQHWLVAMGDRQSSHPENSKAVDKLMKALVDLGEGTWGFQLPTKC